MQHADFSFEIKSLTGEGRIEGMLAGYSDVDRVGDRLLPGSLTKSLADRGGRPLPMLLHHDMSRPIGTWSEWREADDGLHVSGALTLSTRDAQEAFDLAKSGALQGLSIGWAPVRHRAAENGVREIAEAVLYEGSLVSVPAHPRTQVSAVKSIASARDIAELLQEAGISGRRAKIAAGAAWKAINQADDEAAHDAAIAAVLSQSLSRIQSL